jgi:hypothetical protein
MATFQDLVNEVDGLLGLTATGVALQLNSPTRERAFEAYVFSLILRAVQQAGGTVEIKGVLSGPNPNPVVFRGAPGQMSSQAQDFAYARCVLAGYAFEVHLDVQYLGSSGATHEVDVSIYDALRADAARSFGAVPGIRHLYGAVECKFYDSTLGTALGRAFVGLVDDCGTLQVKCFATNGQSSGLARYFTQGRRPQPFFDLSPLRPAVESRFVSHVEQALRKWRGIT